MQKRITVTERNNDRIVVVVVVVVMKKTGGKKNNLIEKVKERKIKRLVEKSKEMVEKESDKKNLWKINLQRKGIIKRENKNESVGEREMMMMMVVIVVMVGETDNVIEKVKGIKERKI